VPIQGLRYGIGFFTDIHTQSIPPYLKNGVGHLVVAKVDDDNIIVGRMSLFFWLAIYSQKAILKIKSAK
jgi:hypothetical protein